MRSTKIKQSKIVREIRQSLEREKRGPVTLSLNLSLWEKFKSACKQEGLPASAVAEKLMEEFIASK